MEKVKIKSKTNYKVSIYKYIWEPFKEKVLCTAFQKMHAAISELKIYPADFWVIL